MTVHAAAGQSSEWYTPGIYIDAARDTMGAIYFDPYSSKEANKTVKALLYGTRENSVPPEKWRAQTVFMNPPYSDYRGQANDCLGYLYNAYLETRIGEFIALVQMSVLYQPYAQAIMKAGSICMVNHRIQFVNGETGKPMDRPSQMHVFLYMSPWRNAHQFEDNFKQFGAVLHSHVQIQTEDYYA